MSGHGRVGQSGLKRAVERTGTDTIRAAICRSLSTLLAIGTESGLRGGLSQAGLAHSVGVCLLEMTIVARGKGKSVGTGTGAGMPAFVDVKLTLDERNTFSALVVEPGVLVKSLQALVDDGYRVGCAWSADHQTYTVSLTCRDEDSPNNGLCMTSFAGDLSTAVALAIFKHRNVTNGRWLGDGTAQIGMFG
jgi:hypothetical protein